MNPTDILEAPPTASEATSARPRVGFVSLGCPKNLVDSEVMMGLLDRAGAELTADAGTADILVVNTCSFIDSAKRSRWTPSLRWRSTRPPAARAS